MSALATSLLQDLDPTVRRTAAEELGAGTTKAGEQEDAIEALVCALSDPNAGVQEAAIGALTAFNPRRVATQVIPLLRGGVQLRNLAVEVLQQLGPSATEPLFQASTDPDPHIRKFGAEILGHLGGAEAVTGLLGLLSDSCPNVRATAAEGLGNLGDRRAVGALMAAVNDEEPWVTFSVIGALGDIGDPRVVGTLRELLSAEDMAIRCMVVEALGKIGDSEVLPDLLLMLPKARLPLRHRLFVTIVNLVGDRAEIFRREEMRDYLFRELIAALNTREPEVQLAAMQGLRLIGNSRATGALLAFLKTHRPIEEALQGAMLNALSQMGDDTQLIQAAVDSEEEVALLCIGSLAERRSTQAVPALCDLVLTSDSREIRKAAITALRRIGVTGAEATVLTAISDLSGCVRGEAARIVAEAKLEEAHQALWERLDYEPYPDVVAEQVGALVVLGEGKGTEQLQALLNHSRPEVRSAAVTSWSDVGNPVVKQLLLGHVNDPDWRVRMEIVERLADQEDEMLLTPFLNATSDSHPYVRQAAVQALGKRSGPVVCEALRMAGLTDSDLWVRTRAVEQLSRQQDMESGPMLIELLGNAPVPLQIVAARALGELGERRGVDALRRVQQGGDREIAEAATWALARMGAPAQPPEGGS